MKLLMNGNSNRNDKLFSDLYNIYFHLNLRILHPSFRD
jgi:hypothetical protein